MARPEGAGRRLVLASASPARLGLLRSAGFDPEVVVSHVDEGGVATLGPAEAVLTLAERKARAVARRPEGQTGQPLILGCDSLMSFGGVVWGKPASPAEAIVRWRKFRGSRGTLHTGHFLIDTATGRYSGASDHAVIRFGTPTDAEIEAYSRTEEAMAVAGPFTLEGRSAPWVDAIEGNYGTVVGVSLPVVRRLLANLGIDVVRLWR